MNIKTLSFNYYLLPKEERMTFSQWKLWRASREIDLQRIADDLQPQVIGPEKQNIDLLVKTVETLKELRLIKSLKRRISDNDTIEVIQRDMKRKALKDILDHGNGD